MLESEKRKKILQLVLFFDILIMRKVDISMVKTEKHVERLLSCAFFVICGFVACLLGVLTLSALIDTTVMGTDNSYRESVTYYRDSLLLNLITLLDGIIVLFCIRLLKIRCSPKVLTSILFCWTAAVGIVWVCAVRSAPTQDSWIVTNAAASAAMGDYSDLQAEYFIRFPFQLGYVLWSELWIRVLNLQDNFLALEIINVLCLAGTFAVLSHLARYISSCEKVFHFTLVLCAACVPAVLFCTFLYGNMPGLLFACCALLCAVLFMRKRRWYFAVAAAAAVGIAVSLKMNFMIVLVAMCIILTMDAVKQKKLSSVLCVILCVACGLSVSAGVQAGYEKRAQTQFGDGIPMTSWMAMGFSDSVIAPGWYSGEYTVTNFKKHNFDADAASAESVEVIKDRIRGFAQAPGEAVSFFYHKFVSQWNEPTYQSIWTNEVRGFYGGEQARSALAVWVCEDGRQTVEAFMNAYQQIILVGVCIAAVLCFMRRNEVAALLLLIILGGMLYHLLCEAKSQYSITYFILMLPLAAWGYDFIINAASGKFKKLLTEGKKIKFMRRNA